MTDDHSDIHLTVTLKKGRDKPVRMGHPWIFSGAIGKVTGKGAPGDLCKVQSSEGTAMGIGYHNRESAISVRMLCAAGQNFSDDVLNARIETASTHRATVLRADTDSLRLINSEGDFLPGLIVDKVADGLVIQILTAGMERMRAAIVSALNEVCRPTFIFERSDTDARKREGLTPCEGVVSGHVPETVTIVENGLRFAVDVSKGQKTGYFFDQRENRRLLRKFVGGKSVLDCFSYSGGFAANALEGGATRVEVVDISASAIEWAKQNIAHNFTADTRTDFVCTDVFKFLRESPNTYDCIVCDPPKFARHQKDVSRAARGYKDVNLCAMKKLNPGGILFTFSCSSAVDIKLFRQIVFAAAADSGRPIQLLHSLSAGPDHPVNIAHMEGEYLKGLVLRVIN